MGTARNIPDTFTERDVELSGVIRRTIDKLAEHGGVERQIVYDKVRASVERKIAARRSAGESPDEASYRRSIENAIRLAEDHYRSDQPREALPDRAADAGPSSFETDPFAHLQENDTGWHPQFMPLPAEASPRENAGLPLPRSRRALLAEPREDDPVAAGEATPVPGLASPDRVPPARLRRRKGAVWRTLRRAFGVALASVVLVLAFTVTSELIVEPSPDRNVPFPETARKPNPEVEIAASASTGREPVGAPAPQRAAAPSSPAAPASADRPPALLPETADGDAPAPAAAPDMTVEEEALASTAGNGSLADVALRNGEAGSEATSPPDQDGPAQDWEGPMQAVPEGGVATDLKSARLPEPSAPETWASEAQPAPVQEREPAPSPPADQEALSGIFDERFAIGPSLPADRVSPPTLPFTPLDPPDTAGSAPVTQAGAQQELAAAAPQDEWSDDAPPAGTAAPGQPTESGQTGPSADDAAPGVPADAMVESGETAAAAESEGEAEVAALPPLDRTIVVPSRDTGARSVRWTVARQPPVGGAAPEASIQADVSIDASELGATMVVRRNTDSAIPASHVIELIFAGGGAVNGQRITAVGPASMRTAPDGDGEDLIAFPFEIGPGHFVMTLSDNPESRERNLQLLRERDWMAFPLTLANGEVMPLVFEKGGAGGRVFRKVFESWQAGARP